MTISSQNLLQEHISDLLLSKEFKAMAEMNGFNNIDAILLFPLTLLLKKPEFSYHIYQELVEYLKQKDLLHLLKHE